MHRILIQLGPVPLYAFGVSLALAFLLGIRVAQVRARRRGVSPDLILDLSLYLLLGAIVGSRLFHAFANWSDYRSAPAAVFKIWEGGLSFQGGVIGAILCALWFLRSRKLSFWPLSDIVIPSVALGQALGRIGCFLNGCCFGAPTELPWGVTFPPDSFAAADYGPAHCLHPVQLYSSAADLAVFALLLAFSRRSRLAGATFCLYGVLAGSVRFGLEFLRGDEPRILGPLTLYHLVSAGIALVSIGLWAYLARKFGRRVKGIEQPQRG